MSATTALLTWLKECRPDLHTRLLNQPSITDTFAMLNAETGLNEQWHAGCDSSDYELSCFHWLAAFQSKREAPPSAPKKPPPQVPFEVWNTKPINADDCMAAVRAMCAGKAVV